MGTEEQAPRLRALTDEEAAQMKAAVNRYIERQDVINEILAKEDFLLLDIATERLIMKRNIVNPIADLTLLCRVIPKIIGAAKHMGAEIPEEIGAAFDAFVAVFNEQSGNIVAPETNKFGEAKTDEQA